MVSPAVVRNVSLHLYWEGDCPNKGTLRISEGEKTVVELPLKQIKRLIGRNAHSFPVVSIASKLDALSFSYFLGDGKTTPIQISEEIKQKNQTALYIYKSAEDETLQIHNSPLGIHFGTCVDYFYRLKTENSADEANFKFLLHCLKNYSHKEWLDLMGQCTDENEMILYSVEIDLQDARKLADEIYDLLKENFSYRADQTFDGVRTLVKENSFESALERLETLEGECKTLAYCLIIDGLCNEGFKDYAHTLYGKIEDTLTSQAKIALGEIFRKESEQWL